MILMKGIARSIELSAKIDDVLLTMMYRFNIGEGQLAQQHYLLRLHEFTGLEA